MTGGVLTPLTPYEAAIVAFTQAVDAGGGGVPAFTAVAAWLWASGVGVLRPLDRRFRDRGVLGRLRVDPTARRKLVATEQGATVLALGGTPGQPYQPSMGG